MKVVKVILKYLIAFTSELKKTAEAVNDAASAEELDNKIHEITGI